ncbi:hypothetical protein QE152_g41224 [Popillia japonica]|uniref:Uncharacterized protein n=1 Tax=Popillia japonica TaxID=7064 RepID=A0AAW1H5X3_POPJA
MQHKRVRLEQPKEKRGEKKTLTETVTFSQRVDTTGQSALPGKLIRYDAQARLDTSATYALNEVTARLDTSATYALNEVTVSSMWTKRSIAPYFWTKKGLMKICAAAKTSTADFIKATTRR